MTEDHRKPAIGALIVAAGRGTRARTETPKQYALLGGEPVLRRTVRAFLAHAAVTEVRVVISEGDRPLYDAAIAPFLAHEKLGSPVPGGASRQGSVANGLHALEAMNPELVLIHDGARPFVSQETISDVIGALGAAPGAIAALPVADTLKAANSAGGIERTVPRDGLWRASTPQGFHFDRILGAHREAEDDSTFTDDASLLEATGVHVALVPDHPTNIKLTYKEDFIVAERLIATAEEYRTGLGYDVHAFEPGDRVILCGVAIPFDRQLKGHSDADVGMHALTDALYGAIGDGDIGIHFPPSDPQWKGAASEVFLTHARERVAARGGRIVSVDITLIAEAPKVSPHRDAMIERISTLLDIAPGGVSIKATTTERLGFTGRQEGIAAQAVATVALPTAV